MKKTQIALACVFMGIFACAPQNYKNSYSGVNAEQISANKNYVTCETPELVNLPMQHIAITQKQLFERGYTITGVSYFNTRDSVGDYSQNFAINSVAGIATKIARQAAVSPNSALNFGKEIGACLVLYGKSYTGEKMTNQAVTATSSTYQSGTTTGSIGPYGVTAFSSGMTTNNARYFVPNQESTYDYAAAYAVKVKDDKSSLGLMLVDLPDVVKQKRDSGEGAVVFAVRKGSNADKADIFNGDVLLSVNNAPLKGGNSGGGLSLQNGENIIKIYRNDKEYVKKILVTGEE